MTPAELVERVAQAMQNVYLSRQPKWSGAEGYPLEEFIPEAAVAIALALEEAARVADRYEIPMCETSASHIAAAIRALITD